jgi:hypothetical protein
MSFYWKFLISYPLIDCYTCLTPLPSSFLHSYNYSSAYYVITLWREQSMIPRSAVYSDPFLPPSFVEVLFSLYYRISSVCISMALQPNLGPAPSLLMFTHHTHTHTPNRTPLYKWSARCRGRCLHSTQQTQELKFLALSGIRTRDSTYQTATYLLLIPHGHRNRQKCRFWV